MKKLIKAKLLAKKTLELVPDIPPELDTTGISVGHAVWLLMQILGRPEIKRDEANRYLGYAHGILVHQGILELYELRNIVRDLFEQEASRNLNLDTLSGD